MKKVRLIYVIAFIQGIYIYIMKVVLQPFVLMITGSMAFVGFIDGLTYSVAPSVIQLPGGWIADRIGRKKPMIFGSILIILGFNMYALAFLTSQWAFVVAGALFMGLGSIGIPSRDSFIAESVGKKHLVMAFNILAFAMVVPGVISSAAGGRLADRFGYGTIFMLCTSLELACLLILVFYVKESLVAPQKKVMLVKSMKHVLSNIFKIPRNLAIFYLILSLDSLFWGIGFRIVFGFLKDSYNLSLSQIGALGSVFTISWAVFQIPIGKYMMQRSCKASLLMSEVIGVLGLIGLLFFRDFYLLAACQVFLGLVPAFWVPAIRVLISNSVVQHERAEALGRFVFFNGVTGFIAPVIGGFLYQAYGMKVPLVINIIGAFFMMFSIMFFVRETKDKALGDLVVSKIEK